MQSTDVVFLMNLYCDEAWQHLTQFRPARKARSPSIAAKANAVAKQWADVVSRALATTNTRYASAKTINPSNMSSYLTDVMSPPPSNNTIVIPWAITHDTWSCLNENQRCPRNSNKTVHTGKCTQHRSLLSANLNAAASKSFTAELTTELASMRYSPPQMSAQANDRQWALSIPPGAAASSSSQRQRHTQTKTVLDADQLRQLAGDYKQNKTPWCLTVRHSSAGRGRLHVGPHNDWQLPMKVYNGLIDYIAEPWQSRVTDVGTIGAVIEQDHQIDVLLCGLHEQLCTTRGKTTGITIYKDSSIPDLPPRYQQQILETHFIVGDQLASIGYRGPYGIDAWTYVFDQDLRLNPLSDINARYSMGWAAHLAANQAFTGNHTLATFVYSFA